MKKLKWLLLSLLITFPFLQSCDKDDQHRSLAMVTVKVINEGDYYFVSNRGNKIYPGDKSMIGSYKAEDGKRAFIYFEELPEKLEGYDYNIRLYGIETILTKPVIEMTEETRDSIGDDPISVSQASIHQGYLNIEFYVPAHYTSCMLNLVDNLTEQEQEHEPEQKHEPDKDYTYLEFRANAEGSFSGPLVRGYVCFELDNYDPSLTGKKGLEIRVNTVEGKVRYIKINASDLKIATPQYRNQE